MLGLHKGSRSQLRYRCIILTIIAVLMLHLPNAYALPPCLIQHVSLDYPSSAMAGQRINMLTHIQATCLQWPPMSAAYVIRVDLTDLNTSYILSTNTYQLAYNQTVIDTILVNPATTPTSQAPWTLEVDLYIFLGSQMLVHGAYQGTVKVGDTSSNIFSTSTTITQSNLQTSVMPSSFTKIQTLPTARSTNFGPSIEQLDEILIILLVILVSITLVFAFKLNKR